jgi:TRAP-type C4-dicarboxylate transport system substrate-binding protein
MKNRLISRVLGLGAPIALALTSLALVMASAPANAELQKVIIRVSADLPPPPHPTAVAMEWFKKEVEAQFPKGSEVRNFFAGALYKDPDAMSAMTQGNLEMGWLVTGKTAATDIWMSIIGQPGVLTTVAAIHDLPNQATGKMLLDRLREKHFIEPFGFVDLSFALAMAGKQRLLTVDSFKGKKIRTFAAGVNPVVASWGASPVVMSFGDVPSALESGVLDGVITSIGGWRAITEQTPYYTIGGISTVTFDNYWVGASQAWLNGLNADTQAKVRELVGKAMTYQNELNWCNDQFAIRKYKADKPSDPGIYVASPAEAKPLQDAIGNNVADYLKGKLPKEAHSWVDRYLEEGRAASAKLGPGSDPLESLDCAQHVAALKK